MCMSPKDANGNVGLGTVSKWPKCRDPAITHCENAQGESLRIG